MARMARNKKKVAQKAVYTIYLAQMARIEALVDYLEDYYVTTSS